MMEPVNHHYKTVTQFQVVPKDSYVQMVYVCQIEPVVIQESNAQFQRLSNVLITIVWVMFSFVLNKKINLNAH